MTTSAEDNQPGLFSGATIFDRWTTAKLVLLPAAIALIFTGPAMLLGIFVGQLDKATSPGVSSVPLPDGWERRELETADGSGSGGKFATFVVVSPDNVSDPEAAQDAYREFLATRGWRETDDFGRAAFERGSAGAETILILESDFRPVSAASTYGQPPGVEDFLVDASYADWGETARNRLAWQIFLGALVTTFAPGLVLLGIREMRTRRLSSTSQSA